MIWQIKTFKDIYNAVQEELKVQNGDTTALNRIKRIINAVYLNEVVPMERWKWLRGSIDLTQEAKVNNGTVSVAQNSKTVTLSSAPTNSQKGNWFSTTGYQERYRIAQHTAGATTLTLKSEYTGSTDTAATYDIWSDYVALPAEARETIEVTQDFSNEPLNGKGLQEFRKLVNLNPKLESRPRYYSTGDYVDPTQYETITSLPASATRSSENYVRTITFASDVSSLISQGDRIEITSAAEGAYNQEAQVATVSSASITYTGLRAFQESSAVDTGITVKRLSEKTDAEQYRQLLIYPSKLDKKVTLHVDYVKDVRPMEDDTDEPLIPIEHRAVLVYGALQTAWRSIGRNPEEAGINAQLFQSKLAAMRGKVDDSTDTPTLRPSRDYLSQKRHSARRRHPRNFGNLTGFGGGSSSPSVIRGAAGDVASYDSDGELASSGFKVTDLSNEGKFVIRDTVGTLTSSSSDVPSGTVVGTTDSQSLTNKTLISPTINSAVIDSATINSSTLDSATINSSTLDSATINSSTIDSATINSSTLDSATINSSTIDSATINSSTLDSATINSSTLDSVTINSSTIDSATINSSTLDSATINSSTIDSATINSSTLDSATINSSTIDSATITNGSADSLSLTDPDISGDLDILGSTSGKTSLKAAATTTSYSVTMPNEAAAATGETMIASSRTSNSVVLEWGASGDDSWTMIETGANNITFNDGSRNVNGIVKDISAAVTLDTAAVAITTDTLTTLSDTAGMLYEASDTVRVFTFYDVIDSEFKGIGDTSDSAGTADSAHTWDYRFGSNDDFISAGITLARHVPIGYVDATADSAGITSLSITNFPVQAWTTFNNTAAAEPWQDWTANLASSAGSLSGTSVGVSRYRRVGAQVQFEYAATTTLSGAAAGYLQIDYPIAASDIGTSAIGAGYGQENSNVQMFTVARLNGVTTVARIFDQDLTGFATGSISVRVFGQYEIAESDAYQPLTVGFPNVSDLVQTEILASDVSSNGTIADLTTTLEIGKVYEVFINGRTTVDDLDNIEISASHDGNTLGTWTVGNGGSSALVERSTKYIKPFVATATTITFDAGSLNGTSTIDGDGTENETHVVVKEVPQAGIGVLIPPVKYTTKYLSSNVTADGLITDFSLTNLEVGKSYIVKGNFRHSTAGSDNAITISAYNASTATGTVLAFAAGFATAASQINTLSFESPIFTATDSNLVVDLSSLASGNVTGNGTATGSYITVQEAYNLTTTSEWD